MRNCFVPNCDALCKNMPKRMMFLPPKNETIFNIWKKVLPKKRVFKKQDRVCERHFNKEDISTTWDHIINGVLHQLERGKPKLSPTAVPILNLPTEWNQPAECVALDNDTIDTVDVEVVVDKNVNKINKTRMKSEKPLSCVEEPKKGNKLKRTKKDLDDESIVDSQLTNTTFLVKSEETNRLVIKKRKNNENKTSSRIPSVQLIKQFNTNDEENVGSDEQEEIIKSQFNEDQIGEVEKSTESLATETITPTIIECLSVFDALYEDAFEAELPSTLWAMHRDSERKFIAFTMFDAMAMRSVRVLHINCELEIKCLIYNEVINENKYSHLNIDMINDILNEMDDYRICPNYSPDKHFPSSCEILLVDNAVICGNCEPSEEYLSDEN